MSIAEWIIMVILAITLLVFLVVGIVFLVKLIGLVKETQKVVEKGAYVADKAGDIAENVKGLTSVGGVVQAFSEKMVDNMKGAQNGKKDKK
ncbi:hypothetical protein IJG76_01065 [Candidatus Saccharibacteria bacterium]|nr:hypothetical protein [Candidatus Saccharibacteria bacterium]